jgi:hypothetical protein
MEFQFNAIGLLAPLHAQYQGHWTGLCAFTCGKIDVGAKLTKLVTKLINFPTLENDAVLHCADYGIGQTSTTLQPLGGILPLGKY